MDSRREAPAELSLAECERLLLDRNLAILTSREGVDAARAQEVIAAYRPNSQLTLSAEQFNTRNPFIHMASADPNSLGYQHFYTVRIDQVLERGGKRELRIASARAQRDNAIATWQDTIRQSLFQIRQDYLNAVLAGNTLGVARDMQRIADQNQDILATQVHLGDASEADLLTFQVNRVPYDQAVISGQATYEQALSDLINDLGLVPSPPPPTTASSPSGVDHAAPPVDPLPLPPSVPTTAIAHGVQVDDVPTLVARRLDGIGQVRISQLIRLSDDPQPALLVPDRTAALARVDLRPDVQAAEDSRRAAQGAVSSAWALRKEDVDVGVEYQRNGGDNTVGLALQFNLPTGNDHSGDILAAESQFRQATLQWRQIRAQAVTDIEKALDGLDASRRLLSLASTATLDKARHALDISQGAFREGGTSLLDLFQAQQAYDTAAMAFYQARHDAAVSVYQLEEALGRPLSAGIVGGVHPSASR